MGEDAAMRCPPLVVPGPDLTPAELLRYRRQVDLPGIGREGQRRLKNAKVLCVGAGGLGSPVLMYLAAAGVGTLGIVEFDTVEESNLQRQIIHRQSDVGRSKADSARRTIRDINPFVEVVPHGVRLDVDNVLDLFAEHDLVVDASDTFATRYLVNDAAVLRRIPCVWGAVQGFDGQTAVFWAEHGPCLRCLYPRPPEPGAVPPPQQAGVLGAVCAGVGAVQAAEAIKLITGAGEPLVGSLMVIDALHASHRTVSLAKDPDCELCGQRPTVTGPGRAAGPSAAGRR